MFEISGKINSIVQQYALPKQIELLYDKSLTSTGIMNESELKYTITLNPELISEDTFDYYFLHEFFHAVQFSQSYPIIVCGESNTELQTIASLFDSLILDLNLNCNLKKHGIVCPVSAYASQFYNIKECIEKDVSRKCNNDVLQYIVFISTGIAQCYYEYDRNIAKQLLASCRPHLTNIYICTTKLINAIEAADYSCVDGCYTILSNIFNEIFGLYEIKKYYSMRK